MKKNLKRTLAKVMAVALTVALAGTAAPEADAAKKIKLSSKSITVAKGKSKKVTIKNVTKNKVKKLTVKSSNKKNVAVKKSGKTAFKVTGKKAGKSAKITASVTVKGKKKATKLTLKVKVKKAATPSVPTAAPTAAATASAPAASAAAPGTSGNPAPGTSGNPAPGTSGNPAPGTSGNPAPGTSGNPAPGTSGNPAQTQAPSYETTAIENIQLGGKNADKVTYFEVKDGTATMILNGAAQYGGVYTYFDVEIPEGSSIDDIKKISFDFEAVAGDVAYKNFWLLAANPDSESPYAFPAELNYDWDASAFTNATEVDAEGGLSWDGAGTYSESFTVDTALLQDNIDDLEGKVRFCIAVNLAGTNAGKNTQYKLGNIKVLSKEGKTFADGNAAPSAKVDNRGDIDVAATLNLSSNIVVGEPAEASVEIGNADIVGDIETVVWSSSDETVATVETGAADQAKATVSAKKAGTATIKAAITTTEGRTAEVTKTVTATTEAVVLEDVTIELTENNSKTITSGTGAYAGGATFVLGDLLADYDLANYESIVFTGSFTYNGENVVGLTPDSKGYAQMMLFSDVSNWGSSGVTDAMYNVSDSGTERPLSTGITVELTNTIRGAGSGLGVVFQNSLALEGDMVFTLDSITLKVPATE